MSSIEAAVPSLHPTPWPRVASGPPFLSLADSEVMRTRHADAIAIPRRNT